MRKREETAASNMSPTASARRSGETTSPATRPTSERRQTLAAKNQQQATEGGAGLPKIVSTAADALLSFQSLEEDDSVSTDRMSHKQVEQHRRLKAKMYFDDLRSILPNVDVRSDRNKVLAVAIDYIKDLQGIPIPPGQRACERAGLRTDEDDDGLMFDMDDGQKLSHNVVEQRRRHLAKGYFDELRALLPHPQAAKFDKNTVLQHTLILLRDIKSKRESSPGSDDTESSSERIWSYSSSFQPDSPEDVAAFTAANFSRSPLSRSLPGSHGAMSSVKGGISKSRKRVEVRRAPSAPTRANDDDDERCFEMDMDDSCEPAKRSRVKCECGEESCVACSDERACFEALSLLSEVALSVPNTPIMGPGTMGAQQAAAAAHMVPMSV